MKLAITCFFQTAFSSPVCSLYILRPLLQNQLKSTWRPFDLASLKFPKRSWINDWYFVPGRILNSFFFCCSDAAWIILFLFFIHFETLVFSRLKLLQIFINSAVVAPSFFFWITSALNRASCFIRLRLIFGSSDVKSIVALDLEPSFNEHVKEVEGSADQETVVET